MKFTESLGGLPDPVMLAGFVPRKAEGPVARQLLRPCFPGDREAVVLLAFDRFDRLVAMEQADGDAKGQCRIPARSWRQLLRKRVASVLMAHNHPSGAPWPSKADIASTREAAAFLRLLGIALTDHLIFVGNGHFSFRKAGLV
jgi:DNA repair protein RadC